MAATISVADWELLVSRMAQAEAGLTQERGDRGQFVTALQEEFSRVRLSSQLEELRAQFEAFRACMPGGEAGAAGAALVHPKLLGQGPRPFDGDPRNWKDWYDAFRSYLSVAAPTCYKYLLEAENWTVAKTLASMEEEERNAAVVLHHLLTMQTKQEAASQRRAVTDVGNGLECWFRLLLHYQSKNPNRWMAVYAELLNFKFSGRTVLELEQWEKLSLIHI